MELAIVCILFVQMVFLFRLYGIRNNPDRTTLVTFAILGVVMGLNLARWHLNPKLERLKQLELQTQENKTESSK